MYAEASYGQEGDVARMSFNVNSRRCVTWWYAMVGEDVQNLTVVALDTSLRREILWTLYGDQRPVKMSPLANYMNLSVEQDVDLSYTWWPATAFLPIGTQFVTFEAVKGNGSEGDIAVDNVVFNFNCPNIGGYI